jgi:ABC-type sugar transport system permease subunit
VSRVDAAAAPAAAAPARLWRREDVTAYYFVAPAVLLMVVLNVYPILYSLYVSLHAYDLKYPASRPFIGLRNYLDYFASEYFWSSLAHTAVFVAVSVTLTTAIGLGAALVLNQAFRGQSLLYVVILVPWAVPSVVNGLMWKWIYNSSFGALNGLLLGLGVIDRYQVFLGDPDRAMGMLINAFVWREVPLVAILFLTSLKAIPEDLYKAARSDGASALQRLLHITIPNLRTAFLLVLLYETMLTLRTFDLVYVLTEGGPGDATSVISWYTYRETFRNLNVGRGAALSYLIAVSTFVAAFWYIRILAPRRDA